MNQTRNLLFATVGILFCSLVTPKQLYAQTPCETGKLLEVNLEDGALFGYATAIDGDTAIVGASHFDIPFIDPGKAFVFRFDGLDWLLQQELVGLDGIDSDRFGHAVALDGDTVVVGARWGSPNLNGSAYIFHFDGKTWFEQQKLFDKDGGELDAFGNSVAVEGETVFIGAPGDLGNGSVFVYTFDGATWILHQVLHPSDADQGFGQHFGSSIAINSEAVIIGAQFDNELDSNAGAAYIFRFDGSNWIEEQKLLPLIGEIDHRFGATVSLSNDVAVVGSRQSESAYIFNYDGANWSQQQILVASDADPSQDFGQTVAISGNVVVIGAGADDDHGMNAGAAYLFRFDGNSWLEEQKLFPVDGLAGDRFGARVAISDETSLIGAPYDDNLGIRIGSAYVFTGLAGFDCNDNGTADSCDIYGGGSEDEDGDGIPDECPGGSCPWDLDNSGSVGTSDLLALFAQWGTAGEADFDGSGAVGTSDLLILFANWGSCP